jgi:hypothetical protein
MMPCDNYPDTHRCWKLTLTLRLALAIMLELEGAIL